MNNGRKRKSKKGRRRSQSKKKRQQKKQAQIQQQNLLNTSSGVNNVYNNNNSPFLIRGQQNMIDNIPNNQTKKLYKQQQKKNDQINYNNQSLLKIIKNTNDNYSICLVFTLQKAIFDLICELSFNPLLHQELIASGIVWKSIQFVFFFLKEESKKFKDIECSITSAIICLKNLITFSNEVKAKGTDFFAYKNLSTDQGKEILIRFKDSISKIFSQKIIDTLTSPSSPFSRNSMNATDDGFSPNKFLRQFSILEEKSPELVWNDDTRLELYNILESQLQVIDVNYSDLLLNFDYEVNQKELRVQNIFVMHFNTSHDFKLQDIKQFSLSLFDKTKEIIKDQYLIDLSDIHHKYCIELVTAFKRILINEGLIIEDPSKFKDIIKTFCNLIRIKGQKNAEIYNANVEQQRVKEMSVLVLDILKHITMQGGNSVHFECVKYFKEFTKFLIRCLYGQESYVIIMDDVIKIIKQVLSDQDVDKSHFLNQTGLIMFILNQIFESNTRQMKFRAELAQLLLQYSEHTEQIYNKYIPSQFFVEIQQKYSGDVELEKLTEYLNFFDQPSFQNVFIFWNAALKKQRHQAIKVHCEKIIKSITQEGSGEFVFIHDEPEFHNPLLENELRVMDIILRIYNQNPAVYINVKLNIFILALCNELQKRAQELFRMFQQDNVHQKKLKYLSYQSHLMLTSILLSIEQLHYNEFNQNRLMQHQKQDKNVESKFYKQLIEKITDQTQLDNKVYPILGFWLQTQVFLNSRISVSIRITFLQIIYLIMDLANVVKVFKENQSLIQFIADSIDRVYQKKIEKPIEEQLILLITYKMVRKDPELIPTLLTCSFDQLVNIYDYKKKPKTLVESIFVLMASDLQYKNAFLAKISKYEQNSKFNFGNIYQGYGQEQHDQMMRIWRGKPATILEARNFYLINECQYIEDKLEEQTVMNLHMPMISRQSLEKIKKEDVYKEEIGYEEMDDYGEDREEEGASEEEGMNEDEEIGGSSGQGEGGKVKSFVQLIDSKNVILDQLKDNKEGKVEEEEEEKKILKGLEKQIVETNVKEEKKNSQKAEQNKKLEFEEEQKNLKKAEEKEMKVRKDELNKKVKEIQEKEEEKKKVQEEVEKKNEKENEEEEEEEDEEDDENNKLKEKLGFEKILDKIGIEDIPIKNEDNYSSDDQIFENQNN